MTTYLYALDLAGEQTPAGQRYYYVRDALGSVRFVMDRDAELVGRYEYGPFGDLYGHAGTDHAFRFAGEQWDEASSLYYLRARHYNPALGRFMTRDPFPGLLTMPQSLHPYVYAGNNPVNLTGPSGRFVVVVVPMIAGGFAGGRFAAWAYLRVHPCADFFHDPAFQQMAGAGMLAGVLKNVQTAKMS